MKTPCQNEPEMWVSNVLSARQEASEICKAECPIAAFNACARFAKDAPFGVLAGEDYGVSDDDGKKRRPCAVCGKENESATGHPPRTCATCIETKACEHCGDEFPRKKQSEKQWVAARFCGSTCSAQYAKAKATEAAA